MKQFFSRSQICIINTLYVYYPDMELQSSVSGDIKITLNVCDYLDHLDHLDEYKPVIVITRCGNIEIALEASGLRILIISDQEREHSCSFSQLDVEVWCGETRIDDGGQLPIITEHQSSILSMLISTILKVNTTTDQHVQNIIEPLIRH